MSYLPGIENLASADHVLKGKKLGLLTNHSGIDSSFNSDVDILNSKYELVRLFAPEHGLRGDIQAGERVSSYVDEKTGIETVSLYGSEADGALDGIECLVYDIQDVGVRHFSYPYLMAKMMKKCAGKGIPFVVLDRYNPLGLTKISGNIYDDSFQCDVGGFSLATQYAMTAGELARYINGEYKIGCELHVVPCLGIKRSDDHPSLAPHWIPPSPNCPTFDTVLCYVGNVLFEGTNLSEGRGTTKPFELIGAPWLRNEELVSEMRKAPIEGVDFRAAYFTPTFSKHKGELCRGLQLHIRDGNRYDSYLCTLLLLHNIRKMNPEFEFLSSDGRAYFFDRLAGTSIIRSKDFDPIEYVKSQKPLLEEFRAKSEKYYIYR